MGEWDSIGQSSLSHAGPKLNPGNSYLLEIGQVLYKTDLSNGAAYIVEMCVHESSDALLPPGTRPSWTANKKHKNTNGNILCFNGAIHGIDPKNEAQLRGSITGQHIEYGLSAANPLRGKFIRALTLAHTTEAGHPFTIVQWSPHGLATLPPSRLNDAPVPAGSAPQAAFVPAAQVSMPGAFQPPALPSPAGFPSNGMPAPSGLLGLSTVPPFGPPQGAPQMGAPPSFGPPQMGAPQMPAFGPPPMVKPWPPAGWAVLPAPNPPGYFYKLGTQEYKPEAELRQMQAAGQV